MAPRIWNNHGYYNKARASQVAADLRANGYTVKISKGYGAWQVLVKDTRR